MQCGIMDCPLLESVEAWSYILLLHAWLLIESSCQSSLKEKKKIERKLNSVETSQNLLADRLQTGFSWF